MNDECDTGTVVDAKLTREWDLDDGIFAICDVNWSMNGRDDLNRGVCGINDVN